MLRQDRLDSPGTLHHIMIRGIEKQRIVNDVADRNNLVKRLGDLANGTHTAIYAWSLIRRVSGVRSLIAVEIVKDHGISSADVTRCVGVSTMAVPKKMNRNGQ